MFIIFSGRFDDLCRFRTGNIEDQSCPYFEQKIPSPFALKEDLLYVRSAKGLVEKTFYQGMLLGEYAVLVVGKCGKNVNLRFFGRTADLFDLP